MLSASLAPPSVAFGATFPRKRGKSPAARPIATPA